MGAPTAPQSRAAKAGPSSSNARAPAPAAQVRSAVLALSLVNTATRSRGVEHDRLETADGMISWMRDHHLLEQPDHQALVRSPAIARLLHDETLRLRSAIASAFDAHASGGRHPSNALHGLNRVLAAGRTAFTLEPQPGGLRISEVQHGTGPAVLLVPVALSAAHVVTRVTPSRLGQCASPTCDTWFLDTSKGGRRRWCSMAGCGNRAKASRHRRRHGRAE